MTGVPRWIAQGVLADVLADGAIVLAPHQVCVPFLGLTPRTDLRGGADGHQLIRVAGAVLHRRTRFLPDRDGDRRPIVQVMNDAGRAAADDSVRADVIFDGETLRVAVGSRTGVGICARFQAAVDAALGADPLPLLEKWAGNLGQNAELGITTAGDAVLGFDPLCLGAWQTLDAALRAAAAGTVRLQRWKSIRVILPDLGADLVRVRASGGCVTLRSGEATGTQISEDEYEIAAVPSDGMMTLDIAGHGAELQTVGPVLQVPVERPDQHFWDPFANRHDPFAGTGA